jgi:hypothetical protein
MRDRGVGVTLGVAVAVAVGVGVAVVVGVAVAVGLGVAVGVGVDVAVAVGVGVIAGVGVGVGRSHTMKILSTLQPSLEPLKSLAMRQRRAMVCPLKPLRSTSVSMKPPELPVHAWRPASGLPQQVLMVPL